MSDKLLHEVLTYPCGCEAIGTYPLPTHCAQHDPREAKESRLQDRLRSGKFNMNYAELHEAADALDRLERRIAELESSERRKVAQIETLGSALHEAINTFENITVADTLSAAQMNAHRFIGRYMELDAGEEALDAKP